jgi:DNA-binding NtrC family response regulator
VVIIVTGHATLESAVKAMRFGSYDYLQKPFKLELLKVIVDRVIEEKKIESEVTVLKRRVKDRHRFHELVGISIKMQAIYDSIEKISAAGPHVLIVGESGTGKELIARVIHNCGQRRSGPFVPINCSGFSTGRGEHKMAENLTRLLQGAKGGTVFFDELTDIPPVMQKLVLEAFIGPAASGGHRPAAADVQLIASSNKDVDEALANGVLNEALRDLFAGATIKVPPLRERREDICLLINHFFNLHKNRNKTRIVGLSPHAMDVLLSYHWPGNVIQLENVIERAFALGVEAMIEMEDLPAEIRTFGEISMM